jgi:hypothetical protein
MAGLCACGVCMLTCLCGSCGDVSSSSSSSSSKSNNSSSKSSSDPDAMNSEPAKASLSTIILQRHWKRYILNLRVDLATRELLL